MATDERGVVHGAFECRAQAEKVVEELRCDGFGEGRVKWMVDGTGAADQATGTEGVGGGRTKTARRTFADCFTGGFVGGLAGVVATGLMPGAGPVSAAVFLAACTAAGGVLGAAGVPFAAGMSGE